MDVIAAHQHGYANVVASMGTALTERQVSRLKGLGTDFVLALDPDAAGQEATRRSLESSWRALDTQLLDDRPRSVTLYRRDPVTLRIAPLPAGRDPDKLIREDPSEWERIVAEAEAVPDFYIRTVHTRFDVSTPQGKEQAVRDLAPVINFDGADPAGPLLRSTGQNARRAKGRAEGQHQPSRGPQAGRSRTSHARASAGSGDHRLGPHRGRGRTP